MICFFTLLLLAMMCYSYYTVLVLVILCNVIIYIQLYIVLDDLTRSRFSSAMAFFTSASWRSDVTSARGARAVADASATELLLTALAG